MTKAERMTRAPRKISASGNIPRQISAIGTLRSDESVTIRPEVPGRVAQFHFSEGKRVKQGDVMVQRGTNHAWANRSNKHARVAFVLVDAQPLGIGKPVTGMNSAR